jgi:hypothetical protein
LGDGDEAQTLKEKAKGKYQKAKVYSEAKPSFFRFLKVVIATERKQIEKIKCRPFAFWYLPFAF